MRRWIATLIVASTLGLFCISGAAVTNQGIRTMVLFGGSNTDSTEQASAWIPIRGANRVMIRLWSAKAAFHASTDADSTYSDSITTFRVAFTDSMQNTNPLIAGDSVIFTANVGFVDTIYKLVTLHPGLTDKSLRGPDNGSGIYAHVNPVPPASALAYGDGSFGPQYMRIYVTPRRRMTVTGSQSTAGKRVVGLKGLRGEAQIIYNFR